MPTIFCCCLFSCCSVYALVLYQRCSLCVREYQQHHINIADTLSRQQQRKIVHLEFTVICVGFYRGRFICGITFQRAYLIAFGFFSASLVNESLFVENRLLESNISLLICFICFIPNIDDWTEILFEFVTKHWENHQHRFYTIKPDFRFDCITNPNPFIFGTSNHLYLWPFNCYGFSRGRRARAHIQFMCIKGKRYND